MEKIDLFDGMSWEEQKALLTCLDVRNKVYEKDEILMADEMKKGIIGIVVSGSITIYNEDFWGNRNIIARCRKGDMFGEAFAGAGEVLEMDICTSEKTEIMYIKFENIIQPCEKYCEHHKVLVANLLKIISTKNIYLTRKIKHLSKRSTREKILSFLSEQAKLNQKNEFAIDFNRQELADYLSVDRSAMSRELSKLKAEHILDYRKNKFRLFLRK
ncbi:MAG: Crp/Fnr family transcriptional regulator [Lachnospiraceae bacterium]|nr:Crp/Fnr family transcriptional regulator [Lachnospiraceae bacterium]